MRGTAALPRWTIWLFDLGLCLLSLFIAYQLRFNFNVPAYEVDLAMVALPLLLLVRGVSFWIAGTFRGLVRYTSTEDARRIFITVITGSSVLLLLNLLRAWLFDGLYFFPTTVLIIDAMGTLILLITARIAVKLLYMRAKDAGLEALDVVIYGAGEAGMITKRSLERDGTARYRIYAFVDDDMKKAGKRLEGVPIAHTSKLKEMLMGGQIANVIISIQNAEPEARRRVIDTCMDARVRVLNVPPASDWINGQLSRAQIRAVRIEDLLGRDVIHIENGELNERFAGRTVLISGAAGSIGSELSRQLAQLNPEKLILLDQAESPLYDVQMELISEYPSAPLEFIIADVRDITRVDGIFKEHRPQVVFHAAAYKHVPLMQQNPSEAIMTNVAGTVNLAEAAKACGTEEFILISTDKAVNPTSVMGASKRVAEMEVQRIAADCTTSFITTRFGNVLGSNGSVIPLFRKQIEQGGPVTVTHPEVTRYFMTIPEACRLVLEAAVMGKGGEIFLFDMGDEVRIADLAEKMIRLSGAEPGRDIEIQFVGLRQGEKLYEELLADQENSLPTHHPRILIGKVRKNVVDEHEQVKTLVETATKNSDEEVVALLRKLVPEFREDDAAVANLPGQSQ